MKKSLLGVLIVLLVSVLGFANGVNEEPVSTPSNGLTEGAPLEIRFVGVFINEAFFNPVKVGMEEAAEVLNVNAVFTGDEGADIEHQNELIRQFADEGVDGIAVDMIDAEAYNDAIEYAMSKGVPVVAFNVDATNGNGPQLAFTQQDFVKAGNAIAAYVIDDIAEGATVLVTEHDKGVSALDDRAAGIIEVLNQKNVTIIETSTTADPAVAKDRIMEQLAAHDDISAILATGQADTEGAGLAVQESGKDIIVAGFDISDNILSLIQAGVIAATTDQQPYMQGFYPVVQLVLYNRYGLMPTDIDAGAGLVTLDNVDSVISLSAAGYR